MDAVKTRIKEYAEILMTFSDTALEDYTIDSVVDRFLSFTNRGQLAEADQVPSELERVLAEAVAQMYQTLLKRKEGNDREIKSMSDNGQSVSFGDAYSNFALSDASIFSSHVELLKRYRLGNIIDDSDDNTNSL